MYHDAFVWHCTHVTTLMNIIKNDSLNAGIMQIHFLKLIRDKHFKAVYKEFPFIDRKCIKMLLFDPAHISLR